MIIFYTTTTTTITLYVYMANILKNFNNKPSSPPIWLMRQAGRYMLEYRKIKQKFPDFIAMCKDVKAVCEITMQPIKKFDLDAAIIFSDILILLESMNVKTKFIENVGPVVEGFDEKEISLLHKEDIKISNLENVYESIYQVKKKLEGSGKPLIGFAAAPWTLATYLIEGRLTKEHSTVREFAYRKPELTDKIIDILSNLIISHLQNQIKSGADIIQLFDTHANNMDKFLFHKYFLKEITRICKTIKSKFPNTPIVLFSKSNYPLEQEIFSYIDCISFNSHVNMKDFLKKIPQNICFQGNLDPMRLLVGGEQLVIAAESILTDMKDRNFIFNLGHGVLKDTPVRNVNLLIETVRKFKGKV